MFEAFEMQNTMINKTSRSTCTFARSELGPYLDNTQLIIFVTRYLELTCDLLIPPRLKYKALNPYLSLVA